MGDAAGGTGTVDVRSLDRAGIQAFVRRVTGGDAARGLRVFKALWQHGATSLERMHLVARPLGRALAANGAIRPLELERELRSEDGAVKYVWRLRDGAAIESVLIPDGERVTLCMSSQVGCAMGCTFCVTGDMGLGRNLTPGEIASQPLQVQQALGDRMRITNLVLMGMGEPLHNLDAVITALRICLDDCALNYSHRRVTVSTVGLVPQLRALAEALPVNLAISLNATTEEQRRRIMPVTRRYSLAELLDTCRTLPLPSGKRITFEYVMFAGFNDTLDDAVRLAGLLQGIPAKVNLIPYNENPAHGHRRPDMARVEAFQHRLGDHRVSCSIRTTRGLDIAAACGQLGRAGAE